MGKPGLCGQEGSVRTIRAAEVSRYFLHRLEAAAQTECGWAGTLLEIYEPGSKPQNMENIPDMSILVLLHMTKESLNHRY